MSYKIIKLWNQCFFSQNTSWTVWDMSTIRYVNMENNTCQWHPLHKPDKWGNKAKSNNRQHCALFIKPILWLNIYDYIHNNLAKCLVLKCMSFRCKIHSDAVLESFLNPVLSICANFFHTQKLHIRLIKIQLRRLTDGFYSDLIRRLQSSICADNTPTVGPYKVNAALVSCDLACLWTACACAMIQTVSEIQKRYRTIAASTVPWVDQCECDFGLSSARSLT